MPESRNFIHTANLKSNIDHQLHNDYITPSRLYNNRNVKGHNQEPLPPIALQNRTPNYSHSKDENTGLLLERYSPIASIWNVPQDDATVQNWYQELRRKSDETKREASLLVDSEINFSEDERSESVMSKGIFMPHNEEVVTSSPENYNRNSFRKLSYHEGLQLTSISDYSPKLERKISIKTGIG